MFLCTWCRYARHFCSLIRHGQLLCAIPLSFCLYRRILCNIFVLFWFEMDSIQLYINQKIKCIYRYWWRVLFGAHFQSRKAHQYEYHPFLGRFTGQRQLEEFSKKQDEEEEAEEREIEGGRMGRETYRMPDLKYRMRKRNSNNYLIEWFLLRRK